MSELRTIEQRTGFFVRLWCAVVHERRWIYTGDLGSTSTYECPKCGLCWIDWSYPPP